MQTTIDAVEPAIEERERVVRIALSGQPNVGKSTVFNILTGLNQHVGNWPGKTVERKMGVLRHHGMRVELVDLPGTYSLTAASPEELVAREYIIRERPDVVMVVINAAALERNLYLVAELLILPSPVVLGLNMIDVAKQEGFDVNVQELSESLGVPVIPMVATKNSGVHEFVDAALSVAANGPSQEPNRPRVRQDHREVLGEIGALIEGRVPEPYPADWVALKLFEGDREVKAMMQKALSPKEWEGIEAILNRHEDAILAVAGGRYAWIRSVTKTALKRPGVGEITLTHRIDQVATHPIWGLLLLAAVLAGAFGVTYAVGGPLQGLMSQYVVGWLARVFAGWLSGAPAWLSGLVVDGIIGGVGTMLTFLPILVIFFAVMGLLEDVGYMARAAYVMDRFMHLLGLHGKSFLPLFLGFGCNVPAIMGARVVESRRSRILTIMLAPLVPCMARMGVLAVLVPVFFPHNATLVSWALIALPLVVLAVVGALVNRLVIKGEDAAFIMEMPLYHVPNLKTIGVFVWTRVLSFLKKAGTVILGMSVGIWLLATLPHGDIETSYLSVVGRALAPVGNWMGLGWRSLVALLSSFVAKENAVATLGVLYGVGENVGALSTVLSESLSVASGLAFMVAEMVFIPCASTVAVIGQETNSWKWPLVEVVFLTVLTVVLGTATYQIGIRLF